MEVAPNHIQIILHGDLFYAHLYARKQAERPDKSHERTIENKGILEQNAALSFHRSHDKICEHTRPGNSHNERHGTERLQQSFHVCHMRDGNVAENIDAVRLRPDGIVRRVQGDVVHDECKALHIREQISDDMVDQLVELLVGETGEGLVIAADIRDNFRDFFPLFVHRRVHARRLELVVIILRRGGDGKHRAHRHGKEQTRVEQKRQHPIEYFHNRFLFHKHSPYVGNIYRKEDIP